MSEDADLATPTGFASITSHCLLHAVHVLAPNGLHSVLPASGSHKIESFCSELQDLVKLKTKRKTLSAQLVEDTLVPALDIHRFYSGAISVQDFAKLLEDKLVQAVSQTELSEDALRKLCWGYYQVEKRSEITYPKWLSKTCTFRLFLMFNCVLEPLPTIQLGANTLNEVLRRLLELTGYTWNDTYCYRKARALEFPEYVEAITDCFERLKLETSLTCEVIADMTDEIVSGVLKKGYLVKQGHRVKNYKRRWFVLQRTTLRYYQTRENLVLKGSLILNSKTEVKSLKDKSARRYRFIVTCGHTHVPFLICADDQKMKQEWMLAIRKAIALAKLIESGGQMDEVTESMSGFYLLKYGTHDPQLSRVDSSIQHLKYHTTRKQFKTIAEVGVRNGGKEGEEEEEGGWKAEAGEGSERDKKEEELQRQSARASVISSDEDKPVDEYIDMKPGAGGLESGGSSSSSFDDAGYLKMHPAEDRFTFEDPSSEKSASLVSDGSSFGFSPSARQTSPGSSPPPLPSRIPIALQKDSSLDKDGYLRMVPAEISIPTEQNPLPHPYTTFSVACPRPPPTTARDNPQDSPLLYDKCDHSARSNPFPPPTTARDKPQDSPLLYDKCDHSARYIIPHDMHFQGTYVAQPSKRRSLTEIPPTSDPISPPFTHSEEEEDVARVTDWLSASKPKVDSLERTWTSPSHLHPHPPNYLTILPPSKLPPLPPKKERSPVHEGKSPSPPLARDEIPPVVVQRKGSPSPPPTEGKPHIVPRKTPILERRSTSPIPGEESKPPPVSPRHSRELNLLKTSGMDMRQLGGMERNPVGMESRPEPVGGLGDEPPRPPPRRSTLAVGGSSHAWSINSLDTPIPPPVPSRGNRLSTPPADFDRRGFTYSTPHAISPPPVPPRR